MPSSDYDHRIIGNVFWCSDPDSEETVPWISVGPGTMKVTGNTFLGTPFLWEVAGDLSCENNIFTQGHSSFHSTITGTIRCNAFWPDSIDTGYGGTWIIEDNVYADPLFCDPSNGDVGISRASLCAPDNSPDDCGLIGAEDVECDITPVERSSWGMIKAKYQRIR